MPSIAAHIIVSKLVSEILGINDKNFIKGNLLPDFIIDEDSHNKKQGTIFLVPDLDYFKDNYDLTDMTTLGYYTHLLLDYYFLEDFYPKNITNNQLFETGTMYKEYDWINYDLIRGFDIDLDYYNEILNELALSDNINQKKLKANIKCFNNTKTKKTKYLKPISFMSFLDYISYEISKEVEEYASKPNQLSLRLRKKEE